MSGYTIDKAGWVRGTIPGPDMDYDVEVIQGGAPNVRLSVSTPDFLIHTTEGSHVNPAIEFEPQWMVGQFRVVQMHPVNCKGYSVDTQDDRLMQVECVEFSDLRLGVFVDETQNPLVALMAFLHHEKLITTGLERPPPFRNLPQTLDKPPQASNQYYRRFLGWPRQVHGVGGHVDCPDDEHWDPGSYDYVTTFEQVQRLLDTRYGGEDVEGADIVKGWRFRLNNPDKPLPKDATEGFEVGWHQRDLAEKSGQQGPPGKAGPAGPAGPPGPQGPPGKAAVLPKGSHLVVQ